eukprot:gb/GFBE01015739.1/.p1 GENE.gb/GFBE01015739.1/~~gb/GFBE01015739.1/.p1  ORF type:complete len:727 (+),score=145.96 gb/GFBE01015739.1/:1-2181(+)
MGGGVRRRGAHRSRKSKEATGAEAADDAVTGVKEVMAAAPGATQEKPPKRGSARSSQGIKPDGQEVHRCIESLYVDELKPFGRILRKRVAERYVEQTQPQQSGVNLDLPDVDIKHLKEMCDQSDLLLIAPEEGGDWSAVFKGRPERFVDVYSPVDDYSEATWQASKEYFDALPEDEALLPGGRYSCAQALVQRQLPFLAGFSLGKVCHLVQLAISKHKILGYCNGAVVPYSRSQSRVKEECAESQQPCTNPSAADAASGAAAATSLALATWDRARQCLQEILENAAVPGEEGPSMIPLSNVKRLFRSKYQVELSETALGHSKLSELLQDKRFADVCEVQLQGQGYIVVQADKTKAVPASSAISLADSLPPFLGHALAQGSLSPVPDENEARLGEQRQMFCLDEPLDLEEAGLLPDDHSGEPSPVLPLPTPLASPGAATPGMASRWPVYALWPQSMQKDGFAFDSMQNMQAPAAHWGWPQPPSLPLGGAAAQVRAEDGAFGAGTESTTDSARSAAGNSNGSCAAPQSPAPSSGHERMTEPQSPAPDDPPMKVSLPGFDSQPVEPSLLQRFQTSSSDFGEEEPRARIPFCPGEPLSLEDAGIFDRSPPGLEASSDVKNTFIHHAVSPLVTPEPNALRRAQSLPKGVGFGCDELPLDEVLLSCDGPSVAPTPAFLPPPTPSSPIFSRGYEGVAAQAMAAHAMAHAMAGHAMAAPAMNPLNNVIRLADLI